MKTFVSAILAALLFGGLAIGQTVVIDDVFGDGNPETNTDGTVGPGIDGSYYIVSADGGVDTAGTGIPEVTEPGPLKFDPSANGNWARAELLSKNNFPMPTAGNTRTMSWTIGPVTPTQISDNYRIQFTAINAARTQDTAGNGIGRGSERWLVDGTNGESAISLDLFFSEDSVFNEIGTLSGQLWEKDSTFPSANNGTQLDPTGEGGDFFGIGEELVSEWRFWEDPNTFSLTMSDTGYTWSDTVTGFEFSKDYTAQTAADFADGYWAFTMGQNPNTGRGTHELSRFLVTETGDGGGVTGDFDNDGSWDCADIDALVAEIAAGGTDLSFDMNGDGTVSAADVTDASAGWLAVGGANNPGATNGGNAFLPGDANLDGVVDVGDFNIWNASKFTTTPAWCSGDFNADGSVDVGDFNVWNGNKFQSSDISSVPEPGGMLMLLAGLMLLPLLRSHRNRG